MKKIITIIALLIFTLSACKTYTVTPDMITAMETISDTVASQQEDYIYKQTESDYMYVENYNSETRSFDVNYLSTSDNGELKINYTSYLDNDNIDALEVLIDDIDAKSQFTEEQIDQIVKDGTTLFEIHETLLSTYVDNFNSDLDFKKISEDETTYFLEGKTVDKNDIHIELAKDSTLFKLLDQTNRIQQEIIIK